MFDDYSVKRRWFDIKQSELLIVQAIWGVVDQLPRFLTGQQNGPVISDVRPSADHGLSAILPR